MSNSFSQKCGYAYCVTNYKLEKIDFSWFPHTWFRTKDTEMTVPPRSQVPWSSIYTFGFNSSYDSLGGYNIKIGAMAFQKMYTSFLASHTLISEGRVRVLKSGPLSLPGWNLKGIKVL